MLGAAVVATAPKGEGVATVATAVGGTQTPVVVGAAVVVAAVPMVVVPAGAGAGVIGGGVWTGGGAVATGPGAGTATAVVSHFVHAAINVSACVNLCFIRDFSCVRQLLHLFFHREHWPENDLPQAACLVLQFDHLVCRLFRSVCPICFHPGSVFQP